MEQILNTLTSIPSDVWGVILAGTGVSAAVMPLKKWIGQRPKVNLFITVALSFLTAFIPWLIQTGNDNPGLLGTATVQTVFWATLAYRYVIQPLSGFWHDFREFKKEQKETVDDTTVKVIHAEPEPADPITVKQNSVSDEFSF